jgi:membrane peptidoglycan carboxypeptidase
MASAARFHRWRRLRRRNGNHHGSGLVMLLVGLGMLLAGSVAAVVLVGALVYVSYTNDLLPPDEVLAKQSSGGAKIYDRDGRLLYEFVDDLSGLRHPVPLSEVSPYLIDATIATEDNDFYSNPGVNIRGLVRAAYENFLPGQLGFFQGTGAELHHPAVGQERVHPGGRAFTAIRSPQDQRDRLRAGTHTPLREGPDP